MATSDFELNKSGKLDSFEKVEAYCNKLFHSIVNVRTAIAGNDTSITAVKDVKVGVDATATADYLGALYSDGSLRTDQSIDVVDGGNFITLGVNVDDSTIEINGSNELATKNIVPSSACSVFKTTDQSVVYSSSYVDVSFQTEIYDKNNEFISPDFTTKQAGRYLVAVKLIYQQQSAANAGAGFYLNVDGTRVFSNAEIVNNTDNQHTFFTYITDSLAIGDTIKLQFKADNPSTWKVLGGSVGGENTTSMQITYIGA